jgi:hypothetical protein
MMRKEEMTIDEKKRLLKAWISDLDEDALDALIEEYLETE